MPHHFAPVTGAMGFARPYGEAVRHAFFSQGEAEGAIAFAEGVVFADGQSDVHATDRFELSRVVEVGDEVVWGDEVDVLVVMSAEEIVEGADRPGEVVATAEGYSFAEERRVAEGQTHRMIGSDAAAVDDERGYTVFRHHERNHFAQDVMLVLAVTLDASDGMGGTAVEAFGIDAVDTEQAEVAGIQAVFQRVYEAPVFVIEEAALTRGKYQHLGSGMSEDEEFHFAAEAGTEPSVILALHL